MKRKALLIGINYIASPSNELKGCINDVHRMKAMLVEKMGWNESDITIVTDEPIIDKNTLDSIIPNDSGCSWLKSCIQNVDIVGSALVKTSSVMILNELDKFKQQSWDDQLDSFVFYYSGHGGSLKGNIMASLLNTIKRSEGDTEALMPSDSMLGGMLTASDLLSVFRDFRHDTRITCIFDSCNSGNGLKLPLLYNGSTSIDNINKKKYINIGDIVLMSGCADDETSTDTSEIRDNKKEYGGAFTFAMLDAINEGHVSIRDVYLSLLTKLGRHKQNPKVEASFAISESDTLF